MNFNDFLEQAWRDHATQTQTVASRLSEGFALIDQESQIPQMAQLVTHVFGEHLGQWEEGVQTLQKLQTNPHFKKGTESDLAMTRSIATLEVAAGKRTSVDDLSTSDQIRVLAVAASALTAQKNAEKARTLLLEAIEVSRVGLSKEDPANRVLAITGNNLACALEEKAALNSSESELMILAAQTARKYWEIAGTWLEVERAEYRLSQSFRKAGDLARSFDHAQNCLAIAKENQAPALELFFGYEALALTEKARGNKAGFSKAVEHANSFFEQLSDDDKSWCQTTLKKLT